MRTQVKQLRRTWENVRHQSLHDGPAPVVERYSELSDASLALADNFGLDLPSAAPAKSSTWRATHASTRPGCVPPPTP
jgi:hypothetical protein